MTPAEARQILEAAGIADAATDARRIVEFAERDGRDASQLVRRRAEGTPVSHILGFRDFWKHRFKVTPDVLDPRPDTETLVELALGEPFESVLDIGTGTGCIAISLLAERPEALGVGSDVSEYALQVANENAEVVGVADRLTLRRSDWYSDIDGDFDLVVSNPPYIALEEMDDLLPEVRDFEPRVALTDEGDGLNAYRAIAAGVLKHLATGGRILVEIGPAQGPDVSSLFKAAGLSNIAVHPDLDGRDRVVSGRKL